MAVKGTTPPSTFCYQFNAAGQPEAPTNLQPFMKGSRVSHTIHLQEREREREIQPYVHSANVAYEDKSLFMSQPIEGWLQCPAEQVIYR